MSKHLLALATGALLAVTLPSRRVRRELPSHARSTCAGLARERETEWRPRQWRA